MKITCPECGTVNTIPQVTQSWTQLRCGKCNSLLLDQAKASESGSELQAVKARLLNIERRMFVLEQRIGSVSTETGPEPAVTPDTQPTEPYVEMIAEHVPVLEERPSGQHVDAGVKYAPSETQSRVETQPPPQRISPPSKKAAEPPQFTKTLENWEQALPGNWLSRIGIVALFIGLGFLAKLAYDYNWISPVIQLILGLAFGGALLWCGQHWNRKYRVWSQALTGGGIAVLYLSFFASYALHDLMGFFPTFALMFLVTAGAAGLALRQNSMSIAIIGIVGAFLVPIILGALEYSSPVAEGNRSNPGLLISYILILDAGILWLSTLRNWHWFTLLGLVGSLAVYGMWYAVSGHESSLLATQGTLTGIFVFFVGATTLFHLIRRRVPQPTDFALMSLNAATYFGISYHILWHGYHGWLGLFSFLLAAFYGVLGYIALSMNKENRTLSYFAFGIAIVFLTVAIPVQLSKPWVTVAWAAEGAVLIWISTRQAITHFQVWGLGIFALVLIRLFAFNHNVNEESFNAILNGRFLTFALSIIAFYAAAYFLSDARKALQTWFFPVLMCIASFLTVWLFSSEIVSIAGRKIFEARLDHVAYSHIRNLENARTLGLVSLWAAYGFGLVMVGLWRRWDWLRGGGYALLVIAAGTTLGLLNHHHAMIQSDTSNPVINYSFAAFAVCVIAFYLTAYFMAKNKGRLHNAETALLSVLLVGANFLTLWALSSEVFTFVRSEDDPNNLRTLALVILWAVYGFGLIMIGTWRGSKWVRAGGYALMAISAVTTLVTLNYSHAMIQRETSTPIINFSFAAFAISAIGLYLSAYVIARNVSKLHELEKGLLPALLVAANILTLWAFSSEVLTFVGSGHGRNMGLTLLWAAYALLLIAVGIARRWRWVRIGGLALLSVAIVKLFIFDTFTLDKGYRVAAYLTLGSLLLAGGFAYSRYAEVIKGFIFDQPSKRDSSNNDYSQGL